MARDENAGQQRSEAAVVGGSVAPPGEHDFLCAVLRPAPPVVLETRARSGGLGAGVQPRTERGERGEVGEVSLVQTVRSLGEEEEETELFWEQGKRKERKGEFCDHSS
ncbi:hypothetical protein WMY93_032860 [Mugilogobius chulae]|uniref:Uncharacterized protein n=1 Tax=Mugilogobius chulae TaxID=88201 RepID=A0AAW0MPN3_9GOBI